MIELDHKLFLFLNSLRSPFLDWLMWTASLKLVWVPLYLMMVWLLARRFGHRVWIPLALVPLLVLITDQGSGIVKRLVERPRPCHEPALAGLVQTVRGHCGSMYGFFSAHAANTAGIAAFTARLTGKRWYTWLVMAWVFLVSYSRIYLGAHYPGDVLCGALYGVPAGLAMAMLAETINKRIKQ